MQISLSEVSLHGSPRVLRRSLSQLQTSMALFSTRSSLSAIFSMSKAFGVHIPVDFEETSHKNQRRIESRQEEVN